MFHPDTFIYTKTSRQVLPLPLKALPPSKTFSVWNGEDWVSAQTEPLSQPQPTVTLKTSAGEKLCCHPAHQWATTSGDSIAAKDTLGEQLLWSLLPEESLPLPKNAEAVLWLIGFICGAGTLKDKSIALKTVHPEQYQTRLRELCDTTGSMLRVDHNGLYIHTTECLWDMLSPFFNNKKLDPATALKYHSYPTLVRLSAGWLQGIGVDCNRPTPPTKVNVIPDQVQALWRCVAARIATQVSMVYDSQNNKTKICWDWLGEQPEHTQIVSVRSCKEERLRAVKLDTTQTKRRFLLASGIGATPND